MDRHTLSAVITLRCGERRDFRHVSMKREAIIHNSTSREKGRISDTWVWSEHLAIHNSTSDARRPARLIEQMEALIGKESGLITFSVHTWWAQTRHIALLCLHTTASLTDTLHHCSLADTLQHCNFTHVVLQTRYITVILHMLSYRHAASLLIIPTRYITVLLHLQTCYVTFLLHMYTDTLHHRSLPHTDTLHHCSLTQYETDTLRHCCLTHTNTLSLFLFHLFSSLARTSC